MIAVDWGSIEETFIVWRIENDWTMIDFQVAHFISSKMIELKSYPVDVIMDIRMAISQPQFAHAMVQMHRKNRPSNIGKIVILQASESWQRTLQLVENFYPDFTKQFIFTSSVDEAYAHVLAAA